MLVGFVLFVQSFLQVKAVTSAEAVSLTVLPSEVPDALRVLVWLALSDVVRRSEERRVGEGGSLAVCGVAASKDAWARVTLLSLTVTPVMSAVPVFLTV